MGCPRQIWRREAPLDLRTTSSMPDLMSDVLSDYLSDQWAVARQIRRLTAPLLCATSLTPELLYGYLCDILSDNQLSDFLFDDLSGSRAAPRQVRCLEAPLIL